MRTIFTAAIVTAVNSLSFNGQEYAVKCPENSVAKRFLKQLLDIQYGRVEARTISVVNLDPCPDLSGEFFPQRAAQRLRR